jgi:hypothetical protein
MAAPLVTCSERKQQRSVIRGLWREGTRASDIHRRLSAMYDDLNHSLNLWPQNSPWRDLFCGHFTKQESCLAKTTHRGRRRWHAAPRQACIRVCEGATHPTSQEEHT